MIIVSLSNSPRSTTPTIPSVVSDGIDARGISICVTKKFCICAAVQNICLVRNFSCFFIVVRVSIGSDKLSNFSKKDSKDLSNCVYLI